MAAGRRRKEQNMDHTRNATGAGAAPGRNRRKIIGCPVVLQALESYLAPDTETEALDAGLHVRPESLRRELQKAIDKSAGNFATVVLAYGLCSGAADGIKASGCTLVIPRIDDCIALFLGSRDAYRKQMLADPGTYYLTRGWVDAAISPFDDHAKMVERWGEAQADRLMGIMLKNYKRLVFIRTEPADGLEPYEEHARKTARKFNLRAEFVSGSAVFMKKLARGPWDEDFIVLPAGKTLSRDDFN